jgi:hypothetical protein
MRNLVLLFTALIFGTASTMAATLEDKVATRNAYTYNNSFIFVENGITFSVYPDGELDFYIDNRVNVGTYVNFGNANITFNSGYDYNPYVQYDDYGAVIQVQNVPIYYDYYGRVNRIGGINVWYGNGRVRQIGGMHVYYNNSGFYSHYRGYVNVYNQYYTYRPYYSYFVRPSAGFCLVYSNPYRRYYSPVRYTYYSPYHYNYRRAYAQVGHHYNYHTNINSHSKVYRNDKRVVARENNSRRNDAYRAGNSGRTTAAVTHRNDKGNSNRTIQSEPVNRSNITTVSNTKRITSNTGQKSPTRSMRSVTDRTVTKKEIAASPRSKTVQRSSNGNNRTERSVNTSKMVNTKTVAKRTVASKPAQRSSGSATVKNGTTANKTASRNSSMSSGSSNSARSRSTKLK